MIFSAFVRKKAFVCLMRFYELSEKEASSSVRLFERALADSSFSVVIVAVAFYAKIAQVLALSTSSEAVFLLARNVELFFHF